MNDDLIGTEIYDLHNEATHTYLTKSAIPKAIYALFQHQYESIF